MHEPTHPQPNDVPSDPPGGPSGPPSDQATAATVGPATAPRARDLVEAAPGVWVATAEIWTTTSTVVTTPDGEALVVDPAVTVAEVAGLAAAVRARGWRVTAGFATHPHWDHVLWSPGLGDAPRWATARTADVTQRRRATILASTEAAAPGHDPALVGALTPLPRGARRLPWPQAARTDPCSVTVVEHDAHAPGHAALVVRTPHGSALLAGDMLSDAEVPLVDTDSRDPVGVYRGALDALELAARDVDALVPGHGSPALGRAAVAARFAADRDYLDALDAALRGGTMPDDRRLTGYVAEWHDAQLEALRSR
ncbi:MBL fold metallo-hydrolase [Cellulosimicrobium cellulans]|uniref:MBL fold metallo-hydrolase n=1 Tax=Cellulosimicrobium cellulans TaxID=1710 RepID=UPI002404C513|nr:MBL fold metallo-hydrolase [Cellulosimicrobium cellulans]MDF9876817.1 hydroxyacylglutathione hydrolase [Cellulosimicrobium cellulans]